jgi:hypothetical protein
MFSLFSRIAIFLFICASGVTPALSATYSPPVKDATGNVYVIEKNSMTRKGYIVHAWQVVNLAEPKDGIILSIRSLVEFNCRFRQSRTMWMNEYRERDAGGEAVSDGQVANPEWIAVEAGTWRENLLDFSCSHIMR